MALIKINNRSSENTAIHGRRNLIINGAMNVWQRGTSNGTVSANTYPAADRWKFWVGGAATSTARTEFTTGQTDVPNFRYYNRIVVGANTGSGDYSTFNQHIEDVTLFDNVTVTLSFYAKASTAWTVGIEPVQNFGTGGSPSSRVLGTPQTVSVGTSWARHSVTFTLPSISGKTLGTTANTSNFELAFWLTGGSDFNARTGSIGNQSGTFDITGIQLEYGSVATPYEHRSIGEEVVACQRYFYTTMRHPDGSTQSNSIGFSGRGQGNYAIHNTNAKFPTTMRGNPSITAYARGFYADFTQFGDFRTGNLVYYAPGQIGYVVHTNGLSFATNHNGIAIAVNGENTTNDMTYECAYDANAEL